jgi:hypothetical protein
MRKFGDLPNVDLKIYGPKQDDKTEVVPFPYDKNMSFRYLRRKIKPDIAFLYTQENTWKWIPKDFASAQIPKCMIECDWWFIPSPMRAKWYKEQGINFLIQRGYISERVSRTPSTWLPFSAAEEDFVQFQKVKLVDRLKKIGFVGRGGGQRWKNTNVYSNRLKVLELLRQQSLVKVKGAIGHDLYPTSISRFFCCVSDNGRLYSPVGKNFEIMASGGLLLTNHFNGKEALFGDKEVCVYYKKNRTDVQEVARGLTEWSKGNIERLQGIVNTAVEEVNAKHLDKYRVQELYTILHTYLHKGEIVKRWGT